MRTLKTEYFASFLTKGSWYSYIAIYQPCAIDVRRDLADEAIGAALHILDEPENAVVLL